MTSLNTIASEEFVLIDNDPLVRMSWKMIASRKGKKLSIFEGMAEFAQASAALDKKSTTIYIDSNLGNGKKGEIEAKTLRALGFEKIYLTTGSPASVFSGMDWLTGVIGKDPPWT